MLLTGTQYIEDILDYIVVMSTINVNRWSSVTDTNITLDITNIGEIRPNLFGEYNRFDRLSIYCRAKYRNFLYITVLFLWHLIGVVFCPWRGRVVECCLKFKCHSPVLCTVIATGFFVRNIYKCTRTDARKQSGPGFQPTQRTLGT